MSRRCASNRITARTRLSNGPPCGARRGTAPGEIPGLGRILAGQIWRVGVDEAEARVATRASLLSPSRNRPQAKRLSRLAQPCAAGLAHLPSLRLTQHAARCRELQLR